MWTLVLLYVSVAFTAVAGAPVNLPQTITCPDNKIYVYVNDSAHDRTPYVFVELYADGLQDCIRKCFGNQFCYSLKYDVNAVERCSLYYFAAYNCTGKDLVLASSVPYNGGAVTIDCLRCPANGDFVTAPPFDTFTDQSIVAKDSEGRTIFSKPLSKEVTDNIESKLSGPPITGKTTSELRVTVPKRECSGSLKFLYTNNIDRETVQLLWNETTVTSGDECAQLCFDMKCGFAFYDPTDKSCRLSANTEDVVDRSTCDVASHHFKTTIPEGEPFQITCVTCDNEPTQTTKVPEKAAPKPSTEFNVDSPAHAAHQQPDQAAPQGSTHVDHQPDQAVPQVSTLYPACIINFQLDEEADTLNFNHYEVEKVESVNDCARICFRGGCAAAVYSPRRGECLLGANYRDTCTNAPSTIRYLKQDDVKLQCFRCGSPKNFEAELAQTAVTTTESVEKSHQKDVEHSNAHEDQTTVATTTTESVEVSHQKDEEHTNAPEDQTTVTTTESVGSSHQEDMEHSNAHEDQTTTTTTESVEISHQEDVEHSDAHQDQTPPPTEASTDAGMDHDETMSTTKSLAVVNPEKEETTPTVRKNCLIKFQASPFAQRPSEIQDNFEVELQVDSAELCATRCYQDGCSTAKYDPKAGSCALSYIGKQYCSRGDVVLHYKAEETTWIHCVNCYTLKENGKEESTESPPGASMTVKGEADATTPASPEGSSETTVSSQSETASESSTPSAPESSLTTSKAEGVSHKPTLGDEFQRGCLIKFQASPFEQRPKEFTAPFELVLPVDSIELCATRCYQDGCSAAKYEPADKKCSLSYNDKPFCGRGPVTLHYEATNTTWIHCVNCYQFKESDKPEFSEQIEGEVKEEVSSQTTPKTMTSTSLEGVTTGLPREIGEPVVVLPNRTRGENASHFQKGCAIKFQARPLSERPPEFQAKFEVEVPVDSVEMCATRCYQDGCSGARFDPKTLSCGLSYNDKHFCTNGGVVLQYEAKEVTWIHCVNCYSLRPQPVKEDDDKNEAESDASTTQATSDVDKTTDNGHNSIQSTVINDTLVPEEQLQGCIVNFQIVEYEERPPQFTSAFETTLKTDTAEICAYRCYQDGCTGAKFDPKSMMCSLSYNDKPFCSSEKFVQVARPEEPVFMHCFTCVPHKPGSKPAVNINTIGEKNEDVKSEVVTKNGTEPSEANGEKETAETSTGASEPFSTTPSEEEGPSSTTPVSSSHAGEDVTTEGSEQTKASTAEPTESSGEEPAVENKVPNVSSNIDEKPASTSLEKSESVATTPTTTEVSGAGEETTTAGEETTKPAAGPIESSGEEPVLSSSGPHVAANADEEPATTLSGTSGPISISTSLNGEETTTLVSSLPTSHETEAGEETTTVGEEGTRPTTAGPIEASGEEPAVSNKVPNVAANVDEEAATTSSETSGSASTTPSTIEMSGAREETTTAGEEGITTAGEEGTRPTTAGPFEASGEEPAVSNKVPNIAANVDEEAATTSSETSGSASTTPSTTEITGAGEETTTVGEEVTKPTTAGPIEASGEEPAVSNKVPSVAANVDEEAATTASETSGSASTTPSTTEVSGAGEEATTAGEEGTTIAGDEVTKPTTAGPIEASGEEAAVSNKVPSVAANVDEEAATTASETSGSASTTPSTTGEEATTAGEEGTTIAEEEVTKPTTAGPIEASGEEPAVSNKVPSVAANLDDEAATTASETSGSASTTPSTTGEEATTAGEEGTTTAGEEGTRPTTAGPIEASGEEPAVSNKVPNVAANVDEEAATTSPETSGSASTTPSTTEVSGAGEETTTVGEEVTKPTTAGPIEASGEEPAVSNKVPNVAANVDEEAATSSSETSGSASTTPSTTEVSGAGEETTTAGEEGTRPTTAGPIEASGEEPAVSNKVPNVAANVDEETNPAVTGTDKPLSSTPSEEELLISSSTATSTISKVTEAGEYTTAERDQSTTSEPVEASGELPTSVDNKVPDVAANIDEKASTGESIPSAFSSTASSADDLLSSTTREPPSFVTERSDETPAVVAESGHFATTSSNVEVEKDHTSAATTPSLPHDASVTEKATEATTAGPAEKEEEEPHVSVKAGDLEASKGDEATTTTSSLAESDTTLEMVKAKTESGVSASSTPSTAFSHGAEEPSASSGPNESEMTVETTTMESDSDKKTTAVPVDFSHEGAVVSEKTPTIAAKIDELTRSMISKSSTATSVTTEEESTSTPASTSTLSGDLANGETENTPSTRTLPAFVTETETPATESHFEESTVATAEVSGEGHSETTEVPMIKASTDEVTTESVQSGSTETASEETTSGMVTTQSGFNPLVVGFDGSTTSTSSTTSSSSTTVPVSPITETSDEETSGVTQPETTSTSTVEGSGEEQSHKDNAPQVETSMDKHTTVADERSTTSQPESSTKIASELGGSVKTKANGTGTEDDEEDSIINPAILEHPHDSNLPANVGFVPSSEPDLLHESREQEEEESEKAVSPKEPDYEDTVKAKTPASAAVTEETTTLAHQSTTTEPPIQLVQDLIDALAGGGLNAIFGPPRRPSEADEADKKLGDLKKYLHKSLEQKRDKQHGEIIKQKEQVDITNLNSFSEDDENTVVPTHEGVTSKCEGRIEFQTLPVGSLPPLNVTNDVPARTPADCAKKCFESKGCSLAGFIGSPSGNISHGVCLLTSDISVCGNNADYVPQHAALNPFVISCMKCSSCTYNIRTVTPDRVLPDFNHVESVSSIGECARACHSRRCTMAQYNSQQHTCMTTSEPLDSKCARETAVVTEGILPVTLECVSCVI